MYSLSEITSFIEKGFYSLSLKGTPNELYEPIEYIISIGGKRIRPRLCLLTYLLFKDEIDDAVIYPSLSLEIFHAFTLIHDDIMDKADMRRGQPTIHKKWNDNVAILSGDTMSILAYRYLCYADPSVVHSILSLFTDTAIQVCEGQQLDMNFEHEYIITIDDYKKMIGLKTAVLLACSAKIGALMAGVNDETAQALYDYGYRLGIAFQITDDYLDVYGDSSVFGKKIGGDIVNNKKSWLMVESLHKATGREKERIDEIMKISEPSREQEKIDKMKEMYELLDIRNTTEREIERYYQSAISAIKNIGLNEKQIKLLEEFALNITYRKK